MIVFLKLRRESLELIFPLCVPFTSFIIPNRGSKTECKIDQGDFREESSNRMEEIMPNPESLRIPRAFHQRDHYSQVLL